jgi:hypothetical protein
LAVYLFKAGAARATVDGDKAPHAFKATGGEVNEVGKRNAE